MPVPSPRFSRFVMSLLACACLAPAASADVLPPLRDQVAILPLRPGPHPDIEALLTQFWHDFFRGTGQTAFDLDDVRAGRFDLNDDGDAELFLMIDKPDWESTNGKPFVIATWNEHHWLPVGWGWGDEDRVFVTDETRDGWHSVDAGRFLMRWTPQGYERQPK